MRVLVAHGADPHIPTMRPPGRPRTGDVAGYRDAIDDVSGLPPVPTGGVGVPPLLGRMLTEAEKKPANGK